MSSAVDDLPVQRHTLPAEEDTRRGRRWESPCSRLKTGLSVELDRGPPPQTADPHHSIDQSFEPWSLNHSAPERRLFVAASPARRGRPRASNGSAPVTTRWPRRSRRRIRIVLEEFREQQGGAGFHADLVYLLGRSLDWMLLTMYILLTVLSLSDTAARMTSLGADNRCARRMPASSDR
jgi:hypothetical protein